VVNSDEDISYTKIDLQKVLHMWQTSFASLGEISFAKFGFQDGFLGVLSLDVGIAIICFAGFVIGMAYMCMWCVCVIFSWPACHAHDNTAGATYIVKINVMVCVPICDDLIRDCIAFITSTR
jgi:hypothetical protein